ncbi:hypothetical protein MKEN_00665200 [Mycena kentingensis (nom. inval.)]|nr:hypothetical protein MKEN_00665200 [Mycena kentingensis (nom. inval.)]
MPRSLTPTMRQSVAGNRISYAAGSNAATSAQATQKFIEKKKEYDAVSALQRASALYLQRIESLADDCETMVEAGKIHGQVLEQWPRMFQILNLYLASKDTSSDESPEQTTSDPHRLVRVNKEDLVGPLEDALQQTTS